MKPKKKRKQNNIKKYNKLQTKIKKHSKYINLENNYVKTEIKINTDINCTKSTTNKIISKKLTLVNDILKNDPIKTVRYKLCPNDSQKEVLQKWFNAYIEMYNYVITYIKKQWKKALSKNKHIKIIDLEIDLNISKIKKQASTEKEYLRNKYSINMHILDYALSDAIAMFKSKISNLKNGYIKKSRLKYLKKSKNNKTIKIENMLCNDNSFCVSELGNYMKSKPNINYKEKITMVGIVQYNKKKDKYYLLVREEIINNNSNENIVDKWLDNKLYDNVIQTSNEYLKTIKNTKKNIDVTVVKKLNKKINLNKRRNKREEKYNNKMKFKNNNLKNSQKEDLLSIDPGIRCFLTCVSNNHLLEIGDNLASKIKRKLRSIDNINNNAMMYKKEKERIIDRIKNKIHNKVNDYHWKIIHYLTSHYNHIMIGNFSTKDMGESNIKPMLKRIGNQLRIYVFKQRLQYKCFLNGVKYKEIDEYCTSKCCSSCGNYKKDLGSNKTYNCNKCGNILDRDVNAAKNILMLSIK